MHQVGPLRIKEPQGCATSGTEIALARADFAISVLVFDFCAEDSDDFATAHLQALIVARQIDGKTTAARCFTADRTITELVRIRRVALD